MIIREATIEDAFAICNISCADLGYDCSCEFVSTRISNLDKGREKVFVAEVNGKELIIDARGDPTRHREALRDVADIFGEGYAVEYDRPVYAADAGKDRGREGENSRTDHSGDFEQNQRQDSRTGKEDRYLDC